ncbi:hypothetical protein GCM10020218_063870 [Dactylosporangium vinaceum]
MPRTPKKRRSPPRPEPPPPATHRPHRKTPTKPTGSTTPPGRTGANEPDEPGPADGPDNADGAAGAREDDVTAVGEIELGWARFVTEGPAAVAPPTEQAGWEKWTNDFKMLPGETLEAILQRYSEIAAATDELVRTVDLDDSQELPPAPWFQPGARRSARRVFMHIAAETAQHAGHADIIRESIDGQKTMG